MWQSSSETGRRRGSRVSVISRFISITIIIVITVRSMFMTHLERYLIIQSFCSGGAQSKTSNFCNCALHWITFVLKRRTTSDRGQQTCRCKGVLATNYPACIDPSDSCLCLVAARYPARLQTALDLHYRWCNFQASFATNMLEPRAINMTGILQLVVEVQPLRTVFLD